jgi:hypothetical protein
MLSRSSSAYQPLGGASEGLNQNDPADCSDNDHIADDPTVIGTEMTSIAIISQHPFRNTSQAPMISTVSGGPSGSPELDDFSLSANEEKSSSSWTNFHYYMCIGIIAFFIFWICLLCRMYLPPEYQFWGRGNKTNL